MKIFCFMFRSYPWKEASRFGYYLPEGCVDFLLKLFKFHIEYWYGKAYNYKPLQRFCMLFYLNLNILQKVRQSQDHFGRCSLSCKEEIIPSIADFFLLSSKQRNPAKFSSHVYHEAIIMALRPMHVPLDILLYSTKC